MCILRFDFADYNFSHRIIHFSFGHPVGGIINPLEGEEKLTTDRKLIAKPLIFSFSSRLVTCEYCNGCRLNYPFHLDASLHQYSPHMYVDKKLKTFMWLCLLNMVSRCKRSCALYHVTDSSAKLQQ
jgi:hypothetical protein